MAEREDTPSDGLVTGGSDWYPGEGWDADEHWQPEDDWDWNDPPYGDMGWYGPAETPEPRPWYRRTGLLIAAIVTAMVALVVASVLLLTNARFGEQDDIRLRPTIHTSSVTMPSSTEPERAPASPTVTSAEPAPSSAPEEPAAIGAPEPPGPAPSPSPGGGAIGAQPRPTAAPDGPQTNVTRNPMSFTPGGR